MLPVGRLLNRLLNHQFSEPDPFRTFISEPLAFVFFVIRISSFEIIHLRITFEGQDMGSYAIEKPSVVRNNYGAAGKPGFVQRSHGQQSRRRRSAMAKAEQEGFP